MNLTLNLTVRQTANPSTVKPSSPSGLLSDPADFLQHLLRFQLLESQQRQAQLVLLEEGRTAGLIYIQQFTLVFFLLTNAWKETESFSYLSERLSHLPQEVLGELHGLVQGEIQTAVTDVLLNPARKFPTFVCASVPLWNANAAVTPVHNLLGVQGEMKLEFCSHTPCLQRSWARSPSCLWWLDPHTGQRVAWRQRSESRSLWSESDPGHTPDGPVWSGNDISRRSVKNR